MTAPPVVLCLDEIDKCQEPLPCDWRQRRQDNERQIAQRRGVWVVVCPDALLRAVTTEDEE